MDSTSFNKSSDRKIFESKPRCIPRVFVLQRLDLARAGPQICIRYLSLVGSEDLGLWITTGSGKSTPVMGRRRAGAVVALLYGPRDA